MILQAATIDHIDRAIADGRTFSLILMPFENTPIWFENGMTYHGNPDGGQTTLPLSFEYSPWLGTFAQRGILGIQEATAPSEMHPERHQTTRDEYIDAVTGIIAACRLRKGKTVYSRTICGNIHGDRKSFWGKRADMFFSHFPMAFRYIMYSPATKGWMGATPEKLIEFDHRSGEFSTVAFAGTRKSGTLSEWDEKNIRENRFVSDYISHELAKLDISVQVSPLTTANYGNIEHLCSHISGRTDAARLEDIIDAINPTPALCGFPKNDALSDIDRFEKHHRHCYGGFVAVNSHDRYRAFVNLRCVHFEQDRFCIYGGGGIVPESEPEMEFNETTAKTAYLTKLLTDTAVFK